MKSPWSHLSEIQVDKAQSEELQADREAVEQPVDRHGEVVGLQRISKVKRKQGGPQCSPEQAKEKKDALVAPSFVSVEVEKPELGVHHQEQTAVQHRVQDGKAELDRRGQSGM